ncbi:DUF6300 family protein [Streptomyces sp. NPDC058439]|uniref:DUF6300 family protein n=1 Tax=Streptomyces sp. NPDC058439 TaxID=3346500 RepID=UPI00364F06FF
MRRCCWRLTPHAPDATGRRTDRWTQGAVLCQSCDTNSPAAGEPLKLFAADGQLSGVHREAFDKLVHDWLNAVHDRTPNQADLDSQEVRWRAGKLWADHRVLAILLDGITGSGRLPSPRP